MDERLFSTHQDKRLHQPQFELHTRIVDRKENLVTCSNLRQVC